VHYPGDVAVGFLTGAAVAYATTRRWPLRPREPAAVSTPRPRVPRADTDGNGLIVVVNPSAGSARSGATVESIREQLPNAEFNVRYETLPAGSFRHPDHRFEWTREQFRTWAGRVAATHGYLLTVRGVGPEDDEVGTPTQLALFRRADTTDADTTDRTEGVAR